MFEWYVARVQRSKEKIARINLGNQGIETFLPRFWKTTRRSKAFEDRLHPLFPGYIFFKSTDDPALFRSVGGTWGVSRVLFGDGRRPRPVPTAFMEELIGRCVDEVVMSDCDGLDVGASVQINRGPFSGLLGTVTELGDAGRVALFLEVLGGVTTNISVNDVGPAQ